jgi:hypothetical protein
MHSLTDFVHTTECKRQIRDTATDFCTWQGFLDGFTCLYKFNSIIIVFLFSMDLVYTRSNHVSLFSFTHAGSNSKDVWIKNNIIRVESILTLIISSRQVHKLITLPNFVYQNTIRTRTDFDLSIRFSSLANFIKLD